MTDSCAVAIRSVIERWASAVQRCDINGALADHTADMIMFDVPPPNEVRGLAAYRETWPPFFKWLKRGGVFQIEALEVTAGNDVAFAHALLRCGTPHALLRCGTPDELVEPFDRLRLTIGLRKTDGRWEISHEHHSFPLRSTKQAARVGTERSA